MISCVSWLPPKVAKEWPDKRPPIPIKKLPVDKTRPLPMKRDDILEFVDSDFTDEDESDNADNTDPAESDGADKSEKQNPAKRKLSDSRNDDEDNQIRKKRKLDHHPPDESEHELDSDSDIDDEELYAIEDSDEFADAVLEGYDDDNLEEYDDADNLLDRLGGMASGIGIGPVDYGYDPKSNSKKQREKSIKQRIKSVENIADGDSEIEDIHIKPTDELFVCCGCEEDSEASSLQVYVFDTELRSFYQHHHVPLPAFPLCSQSLSFPALGRNLMAIGTIDESIDIFNLDVIDTVEPVVSLGGRTGANRTGRDMLRRWQQDITFEFGEMTAQQKEVTLGKLRKGSHSDSVLCLDWNRNVAHRLVSGSSDKTIKLWDLENTKCIYTMQMHTDKVQDVKMRPRERDLILSGGFDERVFLCDIREALTADKGRANESKPNVQCEWNVHSELESLLWHPQDDRLFITTLENGQIQCFDIRKGTKSEPLWTIQGDEQPVTSLTFNKLKPKLFATSSLSGTIKLWTQQSVASEPEMLFRKKNAETGAIFSISFAPRRLLPSMLVIGAKEDFGIWDIAGEEVVTDWMTSENVDEHGVVKPTYRVDKKKRREKEYLEAVNKYEHRIMEQTFQYKEDLRVDKEQWSEDEEKSHDDDNVDDEINLPPTDSENDDDDDLDDDTKDFVDDDSNPDLPESSNIEEVGNFLEM